MMVSRIVVDIISRVKKARSSGTDGKLSERARRWESGIECLRQSGASWRQENSGKL